MQIQNLTKNQFENLKPLKLPNYITNTEAQMYLMNMPRNKKSLVLKRLYNDDGEVFSNKLYTINELIYNKEKIGIEELVMPESLMAVRNKIVGFTMPYIPNVNLEEILKSREIDIKQKVEYLKEVGRLLEKMKIMRENKFKGFYLNDVHENNFILNTETGKINVVDLDSSKIGNNLTSAAKYLTPVSKISQVPKYKTLDHSVGGVYVIDENTEIYCYIVMILNFFYGENISRMSIGDYYVYLEYLSKLKISNELLDKFSYIYTGHHNENPYELLDELIPFYGRTHKNSFEIIRKKTLF